MSDAWLSNGSTLEVDTDGSGTWAAIGNIVSISDIGGESGELDVTDLDSTGKEYIPDLPDYGEIPLSVHFVPGNAAQVRLDGDQKAGTIRQYRINYDDPDDTVDTFSAFVKSFKGTLQTGAAATGSVNLRVTGPITRA